MVFCCFGGKLVVTDFQKGANVTPTKANPGTRPSETGEDTCKISSLLQEQQTVHDTLSELRCQLAAVQGSWLARVHSCVESVLAACSPAGHVSLFGASPCGSVLVLLGAASSGANGVVSPGRVLPMPGPWLGSSVGGCMPSAAAVAMGAVSSTSGGLVILGSPARTCPPGTRTGDPDILVWQDPDWEARLRPPAAESPQVLKDRSASQPPLPEAPPDDWREVLSAMAAEGAATAGGDTVGADKAAAMVAPAPPLRTYLVPLRLGSDVVGALLLVSSAVTAAVAAAQRPTMQQLPHSPGVGSRKGNLSGPEQLLSRERLMGVAAAVVECCLGPHLTDIQRITFAACDLAAAPDLQGLASCLSSAVTEALASELHVDVGVRIALVPYAPGARGTPQYGFLLTEQPPVQQHMLNSNGGAHASHPNPAHNGGPVGVELLSRLPTAHSPASRAGTKSLTHQFCAERLLAAKHSSGIPSGGAPSLDPLIATLAGGPMQPQEAALGGLGVGGGAVAVSGVQSFQLTGYGRRPGADLPARIWKARPFSLESTLLASLASKAAKSSFASSIQGVCGLSATTVPGSGFNSVYPAVSTLASVHCALDDGPLPLGVPSPMQRCGVHATITGGCSSYIMVGSSLVSPPYGTSGGRGGMAGLRVCRMGGAVVPHVHAYVNDTDQPSADVVLLLRTAVTSLGSASTAGRVAVAGGGGSGGGGGGGGSYPGLTGSGAGVAGSGTGSGPASLVLVMGSVTLVADDSSRGAALAAATADHAGDDTTSVMVAPRPPGRGTGNGMALPSPTSSPMLRTVGSGGGGGGGGGGGTSGNVGAGVDVCLALYLTSHERLPASLLCAARNRSQVLLELLLPAAGACLSEAASEELQYLWDAVSGSPGGSMAAGASGVLGRAVSVPMSRMQPKTLCSTAEDGSLPSPHLPPHLQQQPSQHASPGSMTGVAAGDLSAHGPLPLLAKATSPTPGAYSVAPTVKTGVSLSGADMASASLSVRGCGVRDIVTAALRPSLEAAGGPVEPGDADGGSLGQLLMTRGTNNITMTAESASHAGTTAMLGMALTTANGTGWTTFTSLGLAAAGTRDTSETGVRVPRSRLSNTTATGLNPLPATTATATAVASVFMNSYNSLAAALMGSGSLTGKALITAGGGGEDAVVLSTGSPLAGATAPLATPSLTPPALAQQQSAPTTQRRTMLMLQQQNLQQQQQYHVTHRVSPGTGTRVMTPGRVHPPLRRQVSDLLATMPWDVSDTLTVMRTNMDILVSSFWNTLRSQTTEAAPSPHADEDLRFLRLLRVIGGGGCSTVYSGQLHGLEVAVKVMKAPTLSDMESETAEEEQQQNDSELSAGPAARQAQMRAIMRGARELAVMTSISHPNILQIYSYHTRVMVKHDVEQQEVQGATGGSGRTFASTAPRDLLPRLIPVLENSMSTTPGPLKTVLIMECCELGSLADALDSGMFASAIRNAEAARWRPGPRRSQTVSMLPSLPSDASAMSSSPHSKAGAGIASGNGRAINVAGGCGMRAIYLTLLEVALALRHMHSMQLVHCDVKPANVLLKSSASDPRGFTCKLTDFGFVNLLQYQVGDADDPQARPCMRYHEPVGTVTHLAPETMVQGSKLDHTVDIFAFGILMWEVYTGKAPYAEHATNNFRDVPYRVVREGLRPTFPASTPLAFKSLAQACWSTDVSRRPTAAVLVASLQRLMDAAVRG